MRVVGLGFDATASLVLTHVGTPPLEGNADVFCWMDHRAEAEAAEIGLTGDAWLDHTGGAVSPENHMPKLLWLKRHASADWMRVTAVRDLCDELIRRATGDDRHSLAALAAKWPYLPGLPDPWRHDLLERLDIAEIWAMGALAGDPVPLGQTQGALQPAVAAQLGLAPGIPVGSGMIDAQAGMLGVIGRNLPARCDRTVALIGGTSTCLMALSAEERAIPGVWGPFRDTLLPGLWLTEAGQSCSGAALDAVLADHRGGPGKASAAGHAEAIADILALLEEEGPAFAAGRHMVPDWLGNRAPLNDGSLRALVTGLGEERARRDFLETYYATARALALQVRQIIGHLNASGFAIDRVTLGGGHARSPLMERLYRDALDCDLVVSSCEEPVLLGTAMATAAAAGVHPDLAAAVDLMSPPQSRLTPDPFWRRAHDEAYGIYLRLFAVRNDTALAAEALAGLVRPAARGGAV
jgi:FGGY-family pentulose kinase